MKHRLPAHGPDVSPPVRQLLIRDALTAGKGTEVLAAFQPVAHHRKHLITVHAKFLPQKSPRSRPGQDVLARMDTVIRLERRPFNPSS
jgi:hypothetical protein